MPASRSLTLALVLLLAPALAEAAPRANAPAETSRSRPQAPPKSAERPTRAPQAARAPVPTTSKATPVPGASRAAPADRPVPKASPTPRPPHDPGVRTPRPGKSTGATTPADTGVRTPRPTHPQDTGVRTPRPTQTPARHPQDTGVRTPRPSQTTARHPQDTGVRTPRPSQTTARHPHDTGVRTPRPSQISREPAPTPTTTPDPSPRASAPQASPRPHTNRSAAPRAPEPTATAPVPEASPRASESTRNAPAPEASSRAPEPTRNASAPEASPRSADNKAGEPARTAPVPEASPRSADNKAGEPTRTAPIPEASPRASESTRTIPVPEASPHATESARPAPVPEASPRAPESARSAPVPEASPRAPESARTAPVPEASREPSRPTPIVEPAFPRATRPATTAARPPTTLPATPTPAATTPKPTRTTKPTRLRPQREPLLARHPAASCELDPLEAVGQRQHQRTRESLREFYWSDMARFFETTFDASEPTPRQADDPAFLPAADVIGTLPAAVRGQLNALATARTVDRLSGRSWTKIHKLLSSLSPADVAALLRADAPTLRAHVWTWMATTKTGGCHLGHVDLDFLEAAVADRSVAVEHGDDLVYRSLGDYALEARARLATLDPARFDAFLTRLSAATEVDPLVRATAHGILLRRAHWDTLDPGLRDPVASVRAATASAAIEMNRDRLEARLVEHAAGDPADLVTEQIVGALLGVYDPHTHGKPQLHGLLATTKDERLGAAVARWRGRGDALAPLPVPVRPLKFAATPVPKDTPATTPAERPQMPSGASPAAAAAIYAREQQANTPPAEEPADNVPGVLDDDAPTIRIPPMRP